MDDRTWDRSVALCGIVFPVLTVATTIVMGNPPTADARIEKIVSFYTDNRSQQLAGTYVGGLSIVAAMFFLAVFLVAAGLVVIRTGVFARWLGWVAMPVAAVQLVAAASFGESGPFMPAGPMAYVGLILFSLWILTACVLLLVRVRQPSRRLAGTIAA